LKQALESARRASALRHIAVLLAAGILTGVGQVLLKQLSSGNGIDTTEAIWFHAGRMPALRTLGSALLSIFAVGMGASMGREGAPKQAGAVFCQFLRRR
jgi:chloride channel protein, CIC family